MSTKLRWGVLSTANIGLKKVLPAMQQGKNTEIVAIASRDLAKARQAAAELNIPTAYGSYEELLADPNIDAIYNPLPNQFHVPWTIKAAEAGKHVLCEKPISLTVAEAKTLIEVRNRTGVKICEAFMIRSFHQWLRLRALLDEGRVGELRSVTGVFSYFNVNPATSATRWSAVAEAYTTSDAISSTPRVTPSSRSPNALSPASIAIQKCTPIGWPPPCSSSLADTPSLPAARSSFPTRGSTFSARAAASNLRFLQRSARQADAPFH